MDTSKSSSFEVPIPWIRILGSAISFISLTISGRVGSPFRFSTFLLIISMSFLIVAIFCFKYFIFFFLGVKKPTKINSPLIFRALLVFFKKSSIKPTFFRDLGFADRTDN